MRSSDFLKGANIWPKDPFVCGIGDHQSYEFSGGVSILADVWVTGR